METDAEAEPVLRNAGAWMAIGLLLLLGVIPTGCAVVGIFSGSRGRGLTSKGRGRSVLMP
jgi:hypothetical protein